MYATCHTEGCANAGVGVDVGNLTHTDEETGEEMTAGVACGVCGQPIEEITEEAPPPPEPEPEPEPEEPVVDNELPEHAEPRDDGAPPE